MYCTVSLSPPHPTKEVFKSGDINIITIYLILVVLIIRLSKKDRGTNKKRVNLINTLNSLFNVVSCLIAPIMAGQVVRALTLVVSALPDPLINSVKQGFRK